MSVEFYSYVTNETLTGTLTAATIYLLLRVLTRDADPEWKPIETIRLIMLSGAVYKNTLKK